MIRCFLIISFISIYTIYGQHILLSETTPDEFSELDNNFGPNRKYFIYNYVGYGIKSDFVSFDNDNYLPLKSSFEFETGTFYRFRLNKLFAVISDLTFVSSWNRIKLDANPELPVANLDLNKAKYIYHQVKSALAFQFNFKPKRGNQLGKYLDLGVYGSYNYSRRFMYRLDIVDVAKNAKVTMKKLAYMNPIEYGFSIRLGNGRSCIYSRYRLSDIFNENTNFISLELPRLTIGLEFLIYE